MRLMAQRLFVVVLALSIVIIGFERVSLRSVLALAVVIGHAHVVASYFRNRMDGETAYYFNNVVSDDSDLDPGQFDGLVFVAGVASLAAPLLLAYYFFS